MFIINHPVFRIFAGKVHAGDALRPHIFKRFAPPARKNPVKRPAFWGRGAPCKGPSVWRQGGSPFGAGPPPFPPACQAVRLSLTIVMLKMPSVA